MMESSEESNPDIRIAQSTTTHYHPSYVKNDNDDSDDSDDERKKKELQILEERKQRELENKIQNERPINDEINENVQLKKGRTSITQSSFHLSPLNAAFSNSESETQDDNPEFVICVGHTAPITSITISSDHEYIVTASLDKTCRIFQKKEIEENTVIEEISSIGNRQYNDSFWSVKCAKIKNTQEEVVIAGDNSGRLHCWDLKTTNKKWKSEKSGSLISQIIVNQNENQDLVASVGCDNKLRLWDVSSPLELMVPSKTIETDCNSITSICFNDPNEKFNYKFWEHTTDYTHIVLAGENNKQSIIESYDIETSKKNYSFEFLSVRKPYKIATSDDGQYALLTFLDSPLIYVFQLSTQECIGVLRNDERIGGVLDLCIISDFVLLGCTNGKLELWNWKKITKLDCFGGHSSWIRGLLYDPQSECVFSVGSDSTKIIVLQNFNRIRYLGYPKSILPESWNFENFQGISDLKNWIELPSFL